MILKVIYEMEQKIQFSSFQMALKNDNNNNEENIKYILQREYTIKS